MTSVRSDENAEFIMTSARPTARDPATAVTVPFERELLLLSQEGLRCRYGMVVSFQSARRLPALYSRCVNAIYRTMVLVDTFVSGARPPHRQTALTSKSASSSVRRSPATRVRRAE